MLTEILLIKNFMLRLSWKEICNWAGALTALRLLVAVSYPFFAGQELWAFSLLLFGAISDIFDGVLARKLKVVSHTGAFVDGWVDKIFNINVAWSLSLMGYLPWWLGFLLFSREWIQIPLVPYYVARYMRGYVPKNKPFWAGKVASVSLVIALSAGIWQEPIILLVSSLLTSILGLWTSLIYFQREFELFLKDNY